jgi:hypothetical protein
MTASNQVWGLDGQRLRFVAVAVSFALTLASDVSLAAPSSFVAVLSDEDVAT